MNFFSNFRNMELTSINNKTPGNNIYDKNPVHINKNISNHHKTIIHDSNDDDNNNNKYPNTNKLQSFLSEQEHISSRITNNANNHDQALATVSNFYTITQYILQSYYKVNFNDLLSLKVTDLIVDQTYPDSLTLRKLNDSDTLQTYQYFNTISRDPDISKCPIFALSVYFVIRWSSSNNVITLNNYKEIKLLDPNYITYDPNPMLFIQNHLNGNVNSTSKIPRSTLFEVSNRLINLVFPWLDSFKRQVLAVDRTNYILHSLCELFEFMGKIIIQDLRYLNQHALLLPNIVSFMGKFIPELLNDDEFKGFENTNNGNILISNNNNNNNNNINNLINNENNTIPFNHNNINNNGNISATENSNNNIHINSSIPRDLNNDMVSIQTLNNSTQKLSQYVDTKFIELSKKLTIENIRLSQQVAQLKSDLGTLSSMCSQMIQLQRQMLSGQNAVLNTNLRNNAKENNLAKKNNIEGVNNGILIIDKNSLNDSSFRNIIESLRGNINQNKSPTNNREDNSINNVQTQDSMDSSILAPMKVIPNLDNSNIQITAAQVIQTAPSPKGPISTVSPKIIGNSLSRNSSLSQEISQLYSGSKEKRKLPLPQTYYESFGSVGTPFSGHSPTSVSGIDSPFTKRTRLDDRPTPSQTALNSLLYKSIDSPKEQTSGKSTSTIIETPITLETNKDLTQKYTTNFINNLSGVNSESPSTQLNNAGTTVEMRDDLISKIQEENSTITNNTPQEINTDPSISSFEKVSPPNAIPAGLQNQDNDNSANSSGNSNKNIQGYIENTISSSGSLSKSLEKNDPERLGNTKENNTSINLQGIINKTENPNNSQKNRIRIIKEFTVVGSNQETSSTVSNVNNMPSQKDESLKFKRISNELIKEHIIQVSSESLSKKVKDKIFSKKEKIKEKTFNKNNQKSSSKTKKKSPNSSKGGPNQNIKYKLSRENKTIWDLYAEWYIGINGKPPIKKLIEEYGWRRWKVTEDSHFFPTRKIIMQYIETECDRGVSLGRFSKDQPREEVRKIIVGDLEKFRINNGLTLNSLSLYFKNLTKKNKELCIFKDFNTWQTKKMTEFEKNKYSKRKHTNTADSTRHGNKNRKNGTTSFVNTATIPVLPFRSKLYNIQPIMTPASHNASSTNNSTTTEKDNT